MRTPRFAECMIASLLVCLYLVAPAWAGGVDVLEKGRVIKLLDDLGITSGGVYTSSDTLGNLTPTDGNFAVGNGSAWVAESGNTARTSLGLGTGDSPTFTTATGTAAVVVGAQSTDGARLEVNTGVLTVREGDDSADAPFQALTVAVGGGGSTGAQIAAGAGSNSIGIVRHDGTTPAIARADSFIASASNGSVGATLLSNSGNTPRGVGMSNSSRVGWDSSGVNGSLAAADTALGRASAGVVGIYTDGGTGTTPGCLLTRDVYEIHAADDTLALAESGSVFTNSGAATRTLTLPTVTVSGVRFSFVSIVSGQVLRVDPGAAEKFIGIAGGWIDGEYAEIAVNGALECVSQADGDWVVTYTRGTITEQTP